MSSNPNPNPVPPQRIRLNLVFEVPDAAPTARSDLVINLVSCTGSNPARPDPSSSPKTAPSVASSVQEEQTQVIPDQGTAQGVQAGVTGVKSMKSEPRTDMDVLTVERSQGNRSFYVTEKESKRQGKELGTLQENASPKNSKK